jgi:hypothetical protein
MANDRKSLNEPDRGDAQTTEKELAEVCARFADLCQYFSQQSIDVPAHIVDEVRSVSKLAVADRVARMRRLNQELIGYLHGASPGPQIRQ